MHYRVYFRIAHKERWMPVRLGSFPRLFAMHSDATEVELALKEDGYYMGHPIVDTMIITVDEVIFKTEDGQHKVTLLELC